MIMKIVVKGSRERQPSLADERTDPLPLTCVHTFPPERERELM